MNELSAAGRVVIEVGLNESVAKRQHPAVPVTVDEVVADAVACAAAGAAVVHFHAREADGAQAWSDDGIYRAAMAGLAQRCDVVSYPSYLGDASHVWSLVDDPPAGAPLAIGSFDVMQEIPLGVMWNEPERRFEIADIAAGTDPSPFEPPLLGELYRRGLSPAVAVYDVGEARWLGLAHRAGILRGPCNVKLFLCERFVAGPAPVAASLDAYLAQLPADLDAECSVVPYTMTAAERVDDLLRGALERGLHLRVGVGDNPDAHPSATNAELVARAVDLVRAAGFEPATPSDVRERLRPPSGGPAS